MQGSSDPNTNLNRETKKLIFSKTKLPSNSEEKKVSIILFHLVKFA